MRDQGIWDISPIHSGEPEGKLAIQGETQSCLFNQNEQINLNPLHFEVSRHNLNTLVHAYRTAEVSRAM